MKVKLAILSIICSGMTSFAQISEHVIDKDTNDYKLHFGFSLFGTQSMIYSKASLPNFTVIDNNKGGRLGVVAEYTASKKFHVRILSELIFNRSQVKFQNSNHETQFKYQIKPVSIEIMTHIKYQHPIGKNNVYVLAGPNINIPINDSEKNPYNYGTRTGINADIGLGYDIHTKHFVVAPEIRFSYGLNNINTYPSLQNLYMNNLIFGLIFKG